MAGFFMGQVKALAPAWCRRAAANRQPASSLRPRATWPLGL